MKQQEFNMLDDEKLIWICVEPTVRKVRGKDPGIKSQVIMQLNNGQRALFLFQVLYGHANNGIPQFFAQVSYLAERLDIWCAPRQVDNVIINIFRLLSKYRAAIFLCSF